MWTQGLHAFSFAQAGAHICTGRCIIRAFLSLPGEGNWSCFLTGQRMKTGWRSWIEDALIITCVGDFDCLLNSCLNSNMGTLVVKNTHSEGTLSVLEVGLCQVQAIQATSPLCDSCFLFPAVPSWQYASHRMVMRMNSVNTEEACWNSVYILSAC